MCHRRRAEVNQPPAHQLRSGDLRYITDDTDTPSACKVARMRSHAAPTGDLLAYMRLRNAFYCGLLVERIPPTTRPPDVAFLLYYHLLVVLVGLDVLRADVLPLLL